jgi:hypothetical protein
MKKVLWALVLAAAPVWAATTQTVIVVQNNMFNCGFFFAGACVAGVNTAAVVQAANTAIILVF